MNDSRIWIGLENGKDGYGRFTPYDPGTESEMKRRAYYSLTLLIHTNMQSYIYFCNEMQNT